MIVGYARIKTANQNLDLQRDALEQAGCECIFEDRTSGAKADRPGWREARAALRDGDTLVVVRLDRLGRSLKHLIEVITEFDEQGIGFKSVQERLDTTTPGGRLVFHVFGALAQFEGKLIQGARSPASPPPGPGAAWAAGPASWARRRSPRRGDCWRIRRRR